MKKHPSSSLAAAAPLGGALLLAIFLTGCETPTVDHQGAATEYLHPPESAPESTPKPHRQTAAAASRTRAQVRPVRTAVAHPSPAATAGASPAPQSRKPKKVEAEVRDASDLQIDPATRQKMGSADARPAKPKKAEAEVRDASDLQIDDQTKKQMDKPN